jgi:hypothetical protein
VKRYPFIGKLPVYPPSPGHTLQVQRVGFLRLGEIDDGLRETEFTLGHAQDAGRPRVRPRPGAEQRNWPVQCLLMRKRIKRTRDIRVGLRRPRACDRANRARHRHPRPAETCAEPKSHVIVPLPFFVIEEMRALHHGLGQLPWSLFSPVKRARLEGREGLSRVAARCLREKLKYPFVGPHAF